MRTISSNDLKVILDKHGKWLHKEEGGERANLSFANLRAANLSSANLSSANLSSANLIIFQFQKHEAFYTFDGKLRIGCILMPITEWELGFEDIGHKKNYTPEQIEVYGKFIRMCLQMFKDDPK